MKLKLKHCVFDPDRHGNLRWYARKKIGGKWRKERIDAVLPENDVPTPEFMAAYWAAIAVLDGLFSKPVVAPVPRQDSFAWLWDQHQRSALWRGYDKLTRQHKRSVLGRWVEPIAELPFRQYRQLDVVRSREKRAETAPAANHLVKYLRVFFAWAIEAGHMTHNPALGVELIPTIERGAVMWSPADVEAYRKRWPIGEKARVALEAFLQTGARISDTAQLGRQHEFIDTETGGTFLGFTAQKNRNRKPVRIEIPMREELRLAIEACDQVGDLTYLVNERGAAFSINGLGNRFRKWCRAAGLKGRSAHGLRKASATEFANMGRSAHELMAWFGWTKLATAETYTKGADNRAATRRMGQSSEQQRNKNVSLSKRGKGR